MQRLAHRALAIAIGAAVATACSRSEPEPLPPVVPPATTVSRTPLSQMPGCPLGLPQASANVVDRPGGVAVELAAPAEEEVALRSRAENIAKAGGRGLIEACPCGARPGDMPYGGNRLGPGETSEVPRKDLVPPPADVQLEDTDAGVRLIFRAKDEHDVPALRHAVRTHVAQLTTGACGGM